MIKSRISIRINKSLYTHLMKIVLSSGHKNLSAYFIYLESIPLPSSAAVDLFFDQLKHFTAFPNLIVEIKTELRKLKALANNINQLDNALSLHQRTLIDIRKVQFKLEEKIQNETTKIQNIEEEKNQINLLLSIFSTERNFNLLKKDHYLKLNISPEYLDRIANSGLKKTFSQTQIFLVLLFISPEFSKFLDSLYQLNSTSKIKYESLLNDLKRINSKFELTFKIYNDATKKYYILKRNKEDISPISNTIVSSYKYLLDLYTEL